MLLAVDTEASYTKERDIKSLGASRYIEHSETNHYLVSLWSPEIQFVGDPKECPWEVLDDAELISHNRSYDMRVIQHICPRPLTIKTWHCTADLASYLQGPRALDKAARQFLGAGMSKDIRSKMKGKDYRQLSADEQAEVREYALLDAQWCYQLWAKFGHLWPEHERELSLHTTGLCLRGIGLDLEAVEAGMRTLRLKQDEVEAEIPWTRDGDVPVTSPKALALECRKLGIEPPASTDTKSDIFDAWALRYESAVPIVRSIQRWRSINRTHKVLAAMQTRQSGGTLPVELKYFGANHTGRWSGSGGLNMQNLPRKEVHGVDCRACLVPRNGNKLLVADYSQIEARVLLWLAGDERMLEALKTMDLYEAHARFSMGYSDPRPLAEINPEMRQLAKIRVLGLGFSLGASKFLKLAEAAGLEIDSRRAKATVDSFRKSNPRIVTIWRKLDRACSSSVGGTFELQLPSGRTIQYYDVFRYEGELSGRTERGSFRVKLWGGKLTENLVQATARELLADAILRLEAAGLPVVLHVHDEIIVEAPEAALPEMKRIMEIAPEWAQGLPIEVKAAAVDRYAKG